MTWCLKDVSLLVAGLLLSGALHAADSGTACADCHGKDGASATPEIPMIGGMSAAYLSATLKDYGSGTRYCPETAYPAGDRKGTKTTMCVVAKGLSPQDIGAIAAQLAGKKFVRPAQTPDAGLAAKGKEIHAAYCEQCHSNGGSVADDDASLLAGQWMPYLSEQFAEFKSGQRQPPAKMKVKLDQLKPADFDALVNYYGNFK